MTRKRTNHADANAHKGISRAPQGESRADEAQRDQLRKELEDIGRNKKSIRPTALAGYFGLLGCPQVLSRLGQRPTNDEVQSAAHEALKDAIADLPSSERPIGQVILAATKAFEDKTVEERKTVLKDNYGISKDIFKHHRKENLDGIVDYLWSAKPAVAAPDRSSDAFHKARIDIECLLNDAMRLEYLWKSYLFICDFTDAFSQVVSQWPRAPFIMACSGFFEALYKAHINLAVSAGYCFDHAEYSRRDRIAANLPLEVVTEIPDILSFLLGPPQPFSVAMRERICWNYLNPDCDLPAQRREMTEIHRHWVSWVCQLPLAFDSTEHILLRVPGRLAAVTEISKRLASWLDLRPSDMAASNYAFEAVKNYYGVESFTAVYDEERGSEEPLYDYLTYYWTHFKIKGR